MYNGQRKPKPEYYTTRTDLAQIMDEAAKVPMTKDDVKNLVRECFGVKLNHLRTEQVSNVVSILRSKAAERIASEKLERELEEVRARAKAKAEQAQQDAKRDRVRAIRKARKENVNKAKKAAKRRRMGK